MGERLAWLIGVCKTERYLLNALVGLRLYIMRCATVQLYQNTQVLCLVSHMDSLQILVGKVLKSRGLLVCGVPGYFLVRVPGCFMPGVLGALLTAFYRLHCRRCPKNLDGTVPLKQTTSPWRSEGKQSNCQESCCSPWTCMLGHVESEKDPSLWFGTVIDTKCFVLILS